MSSRFTIFFVLTRTLLLIVPIGFFALPFVILFNTDPKFENEPKLLPALIAAAIIFPFVFLMLRNYKIIRLQFDLHEIQIIDVVRFQKTHYRYSEVKKIDMSTHKIQGVTNRWGRSRDINYVSFITIYFNDGFEFELASDVYSNYLEMIDYIESHKSIIQIV